MELHPLRARRFLHVSDDALGDSRLFGFTSRAITLAWGTSSDSSSSRLGISSTVRMLTPVRLPPGRARLATRPRLDRVAADDEDDRDRRGCAFRRECRRGAARHDHVDLAADEVGGQCGQPIIVTLRPAVFDRHVLSLDIAGFAQSLAERGHKRLQTGRASVLPRKPITGIAFCCARKADGHPPIAPASKIMKSRRLMPSPSIWPRAGIMAQQRPYPITLDERRLATRPHRS